MKHLYFAYGSNLNIKQMQARCPSAEGVCPATLPGWRLAERQYADVEEAENEYVHGALYRISAEDLAKLDRYEGYPACYDRREVTVIDQAGVYCKALVYIMTEHCRRNRTGIPYSAEYRQRCSAGAADWGIPDAFGNTDSPRNTLFENGVPAAAEGLRIMLEFLDSAEPLPQAKRLWHGADIAVTLKQQDVPGTLGFYPAPLEVTTRHGLEFSWVLEDLKALFSKAGLLDGGNKYSFYGRLAQCAKDALGQNPSLSANELCRRIVLEAESMYEEVCSKL